MNNRWLVLARGIWIFLALNSIFLFGATLWLAFNLLQNPSERITQGLAALGLSLGFYAGFFLVSDAILFSIYFIVALLIFLRRPNDGFAVFVSSFFLCFGAAIAYPTFTDFVETYLNPPLWYQIPQLISNLGSWPLLIPFFALYPNGQFVPRWMRYLALYGFIFSLGWGIFNNEFSAPTGAFAIFVTASVIIVFGGSLYAQVWRYRYYSSPLQRQQTKWLVYAIAVVFVFTVAQNVFLALLRTSGAPTPAERIWFDLATMLGTLSYTLIPIAVGIAILRYRLWDIDILIRKTLTYALVVALLAVVYVGSVILLQQIFANVTGLGSNEIITVISTLAIAALFIPLRNHIQEFIDRRFYRKKYDAQQVLQKFSETVRDETDLEKLTAELVHVVQETMQPKSVSVWLKKETGKQGDR